MADDDELPDQKQVNDDRCAKKPECASLYVQYEACAKRIEAKGHGECTGYYMDYLGAIDIVGDIVREYCLWFNSIQFKRFISRPQLWQMNVTTI